MIFAIHEINSNLKLLPNITLGYKIYDACSSEAESVKAVMALISAQDESISDSSCTVTSKVPVVFADAGFIRSLAETTLTGPFGIPTISFSAMCQCFGEHEFATLFETMPGDSHQIKAITSLVKYFGWNWVGLIQSTSTYMALESDTIFQEFESAGICIAFREAFSETDSRERIHQVVNSIKHSPTKIIIAFATLADMEVLLLEVFRQNVTGIQWIGSQSWISIRNLSPQLNARFLLGALGFVVPNAKIPGLKEFLLQVNPKQSPGNPLLNEFWEKTFHCSMQNVTGCNPKVQQCTGNEHLQDVDNLYTDTTQLRISSHVYKAVYIIAHALHNVFSCGNNSCPKWSDNKTWQLLNYLRTFKSADTRGSNIHSHQDGNWIRRYELINRQISTSGAVDIVAVGKYDSSGPSGLELKINEEDIVWTNGQREAPRAICSESCPPGTRKAMRPGEPVCCFDCVQCLAAHISNMTDARFCTKCPLEYWPNQYRNECLLKEIEFLSFQDRIGVTLTSFSVGGACLTITTAVVFFKHRHTPLVRANNSELSFLMLLALLLCFLSALLFSAYPTQWSCTLRFTMFSVTVALCLSAVLGKTVVVLLAFKTVSQSTKLLRWFNPRRQRMGVLILTSIQCIICILWITHSPPFPFKSLEYYPHVISLECQIGSVVYFCAIFVYIFLLTGVTLTAAYFARKLPDSFNEATHMTFSLLVFLVVWITFFPVYMSAPEKYTATVHAFAILASSFGFLLCIFAPKCYIILLKPETNTRKNLMRFSSK
ncbi:extracellular calcium-sensing receptor-like [Scyliorhinus torazame]|uniref:extracellular calcium-sensing receptor-like n=1 Tax=Scyliorhinus torazame TaxID=75743 RepID=UPI003B59A059